MPLNRATLPKGVNLISNVSCTGIDMKRRVVKLQDKREIHFDRLVLSLGLTFNYDIIPGLRESHFLNICNMKHVIELKTRVMKDIKPGQRILVLVCRHPYKCPPAPFEVAFLIEEMLRKRGLREEKKKSYVHITIAFPKKFPFAGPFPKIGQVYTKTCEARGIEMCRDHIIQSMDTKSGVSSVTFQNGKIRDFELVCGTPPQQAPSVLKPFTNKIGFVPSHYETLEVNAYSGQGIYAIGDCAHILLPMMKKKDGSIMMKPHPKSGQFAYQMGLSVASQLSAIARGSSPIEARKSAIRRRCGACSAETSNSEAIMMQTVLMSDDPTKFPHFKISDSPNKKDGKAKVGWINSHLTRLFGSDAAFSPQEEEEEEE